MVLQTAGPIRHRQVIVLLALLLKLSYFLLAWASHFWWKIPHFKTAAWVVDPLSWDLHDPLAAHWILNHGDSEYYQAIAQHGYPSLTTDWIRTHETVYAFWPLLPLLLTAGLALTGWPFPAVGLLVASLVSIAAFLVVYELGRHWLGQAYPAFLGTLVLMCFPYAFYHSAVYTEGLFLLLSAAGFLLAERRLWWGVAAMAALLALTRANGALVAALLGLRCLEVQGVSFRRRPTFAALLPTLSVAAASLLTLGGYLLFLHERTGSYWAFSIAQTPWGRHTSWPWEPLAQGLSSWANAQRTGYTLVMLGLAFVFLRRYPLSIQALVGLTVLVPLSSGSLASLPRFLSVLFPIFLVLGERLITRRAPAPWLAVLLVLHWLSFLPFLHLHHSIA